MFPINKKTALITSIACAIGAAALISAGSASDKIPQDERTTRPLENVALLGLSLPDGDSGYLLHLVAQEKGYFKEEGINLTFRWQRMGTDLKHVKLPKSDLYLTGRAEGYTLEAVHPGAIKAFNVNTQDEKIWNDAIIAKNSASISSLGQLKENQEIGLFGGGGAPMEVLLGKNGLDPKHFQYIQPDHAKISSTSDIKARTALINEVASKIKVATAREPYLSLLLATGEWKILIEGPTFAKNAFSPWPMSMTLFSAKFLKEKPALAQKILSIYDKAITFIRENPEEAGTILSRYVEKKYGANGLKVRLVNYLRSGEIDAAILQRQSDSYYKYGIIPGKINAANLIYRGQDK